jgi:hypothetical protein
MEAKISSRWSMSRTSPQTGAWQVGAIEALRVPLRPIVWLRR